MMERLSDALDGIISGDRFISITGGGGKTSLLKCLASYYRDKGEKVLMTTTTKFQSPLFFRWDADLETSEESQAFSFEKRPGICLFGKKTPDVKKWQSPDLEILSALWRSYDRTICEADGSRQLPLKLHRECDPVIMPGSTRTIAVMGIWALGKKAYQEVWGYDGDEEIDSSFLSWYINAPEGLLKGGADIVIANGAECAGEREMDILRNAEWPDGVKVLASSIREDKLLEVIA